jgi:hypothetical protein
MGTNPDALYSAVYGDLSNYVIPGLVGPDTIVPGASYKQVASSLLLGSVIKKWQYDNTKEADDACMKKFLSSNEKCKNWRLNLENSGDELLYGEFRKEIDNFFHPGGQLLVKSYYDIVRYGRTGPGSSLGARGQSLYAKLFGSPLTVTSPYLYEIYRNYSEWYSTWSDAEAIRYDQYGAPDVVYSSRLCFVPKTKDISRLICVEPTLNTFYQLGLARILEDRLKVHLDIDLSTQSSRNQLLARFGSLDESFSTIDLSSASDSISIRLCKLVLPDWVFDILNKLRTPFTCLSSSDEPIRLHMISTMGNGFTFPLQTILFACLIRAAYTVAGITTRDGTQNNYACFGDDLVVRKETFRYVDRLLNLLGFSVNPSKTFFEGPFRESCGSDWFLGQPVRPVSIKRLDKPQDYFVAINLFNEWSTRTGIPLNGTIKFLYDRLPPRKKLQFVPYDENNDAGIRIPLSLLKDFKIRYDRNSSILYRVERANPVRIIFEPEKIRFPRGCKELILNPSGLMMSLLSGELDNGSISIRHDRLFYRTKSRCTPFWDYIPKGSSSNGWLVPWQRWETAVVINLTNP